MFCPKCGAEYREGFDRCADCGIELTSEPPASSKRDPWVEIWRGSASQATVVQGALGSAGIETMSPDETLSFLQGEIGEAGWVLRILVRESDASAAREILEGKDRLAGEADGDPSPV